MSTRMTSGSAMLKKVAPILNTEEDHLGIVLEERASGVEGPTDSHCMC